MLYIRKSHACEGLAGFTLLEVTIVLVIIGFLTAGILVGQSLVRQSDISSIMVDTQRYIAAVGTFQEKYNALPGDMNNATSYWGTMTSCPPARGGASPTGTLTCNGNGNGIVDNSIEGWYFWQHLADAQLIPGYFTGVPTNVGSGPGGFLPGVNVPVARLPGLGFEIQYWGVQSGSWAMFDGTYNHGFLLGGPYSDGNLNTPLLTALEAQSIDTKYDDGLPANGSIRTYKSGYPTGPNCATTAITSSAVYNTTKSGFQCFLLIITGF